MLAHAERLPTGTTGRGDAQGGDAPDSDTDQ